MSAVRRVPGTTSEPIRNLNPFRCSAERRAISGLVFPPRLPCIEDRTARLPAQDPLRSALSNSSRKARSTALILTPSPVR